MKNTIQDLRNHLFETIEALKDPDKPMDVQRAQAISNVAQTLIETAKVELKAFEIMGEGQGASTFLTNGKDPVERPSLTARSI